MSNTHTCENPFITFPGNCDYRFLPYNTENKTFDRINCHYTNLFAANRGTNLQSIQQIETEIVFEQIFLITYLLHLFVKNTSESPEDLANTAEHLLFKVQVLIRRIAQLILKTFPYFNHITIEN